MAVSKKEVEESRVDLLLKLGMDPKKQKFIDLEQRSEEWQYVRKSLIWLGASEMAAACNVKGAYESPNAIFQRKKFSREPKENEFKQRILDYGTRMEKEAKEKLLDLFMLHSDNPEGDRESWWETGLWVYEDDMRIGCSLDGYWFPWDDEPVPIEIKCPWNGEHYDQIPEHHKPQLLTIMTILKRKRCYYVTYCPNNKREPLRMWKVRMNRKMKNYWNALYSAACNFMSKVDDKDTESLPRGTHKLVFPDFNAEQVPQEDLTNGMNNFTLQF